MVLQLIELFFIDFIVFFLDFINSIPPFLYTFIPSPSARASAPRHVPLCEEGGGGTGRRREGHGGRQRARLHRSYGEAQLLLLSLLLYFCE